jgi:hypothetical protein
MKYHNHTVYFILNNNKKAPRSVFPASGWKIAVLNSAAARVREIYG